MCPGCWPGWGSDLNSKEEQPDKLITDIKTSIRIIKTICFHFGEPIPRLVVVGGGPIGCEYVSIFAALGSDVTLIDNASRLLPFMDGEISDALAEQFRSIGIKVLLQAGPTLWSKALAARLRAGHAHALMLVAASAGPEVADKARRLWGAGRLDEAYFLDRLAAAITEGLLVQQSPGLMETFDRLRALGVRLAVDDFGPVTRR